MGLFAKIKNGLKKTKDSFISKLNAVFRGGDIDDEFYEELEFVLINSVNRSGTVSGNQGDFCRNFEYFCKNQNGFKV